MEFMKHLNIKKAPYCKTRQLKCFHNGIILIVISFKLCVKNKK